MNKLNYYENYSVYDSEFKFLSSKCGKLGAVLPMLFAIALFALEFSNSGIGTIKIIANIFRLLF